MPLRRCPVHGVLEMLRFRCACSLFQSLLLIFLSHNFHHNVSEVFSSFQDHFVANILRLIQTMKPKVNHKEKKHKKSTEENKKSNLDTKRVLLPALALSNYPKTRVSMIVILLLLTSVLANLCFSIWNCYVQFLGNLNRMYYVF